MILSIILLNKLAQSFRDVYTTVRRFDFIIEAKKRLIFQVCFKFLLFFSLLFVPPCWDLPASHPPQSHFSIQDGDQMFTIGRHSECSIFLNTPGMQPTHFFRAAFQISKQKII